MLPLSCSKLEHNNGYKQQAAEFFRLSSVSGALSKQLLSPKLDAENWLLLLLLFWNFLTLCEQTSFALKASVELNGKKLSNFGILKRACIIEAILTVLLKRIEREGANFQLHLLLVQQ